MQNANMLHPNLLRFAQQTLSLSKRSDIPLRQLSGVVLVRFRVILLLQINRGSQIIPRLNYVHKSWYHFERTKPATTTHQKLPNICLPIRAEVSKTSKT